MAFRSDANPMFRSHFAESIFHQKYAHEGCETWERLSNTLVDEVCGGLMTSDEIWELKRLVRELKFIPGGRYLWYAGRGVKYYNNCFLLRAEYDTREEWADLAQRATSCLMTGGGIGIDWSRIRKSGTLLKRTGGVASGPLPAMQMINSIGSAVMQGGSRRSALYASLNWKHGDVGKFLKIKNWHEQIVAGTGGLTVADMKAADFNYPAPLDMTNISVGYDTDWLLKYRETGEVGEVFLENTRQALMTAEPGWSFNFFLHELETLRNACTEVTSEDDSDVCNLGSLNIGRITSLNEMRLATELGTKFLICGTLRAELPYQKVHDIRIKNRRLGLGLMGVHENLLKHGERYEVTQRLRQWLEIYRDVSDRVADSFTAALGISPCKAKRAIAPTGSIGILASSSTGGEPIIATAYKRRYLKNGTEWHYQYVVEPAAQSLIDQYGLNPESIESALDLAPEYERRIAFQADLQDYVDMSISSTINLPEWGSEFNNESTVKQFAHTVAKYAHRLRGLTVYPNGARAGQPLTPVPYAEAVASLGKEFRESGESLDICTLSGKGGVCGS